VGGSFTQPDTIETNADGQNTYGYVGENPETWIDPTGHMLCTLGEGGGGGGEDDGDEGDGGNNGGNIAAWWDTSSDNPSDTSNENSSPEI